jgi:hypothetical protein
MCFSLDIDHHQAKKYTIIERQVKNSIHMMMFCILQVSPVF